MTSLDETEVPKILFEPTPIVAECLDGPDHIETRVQTATLTPNHFAAKQVDWTSAMRAAAQEPPPTVEQRLAEIETRLAALEARAA